MRNYLHIIASSMCVVNNIELHIEWIPKKELDKADFISRLIDLDDW